MSVIIDGTTGITAAGATLAGVPAIAVAPGTAGNVLTSNGTAWTSAAGGGAVTGQTIQYGSSTTPSGYLKCDGSTYNISAYTTLAGVLGSLPAAQAQYYNSLPFAANVSYVNGTAIWTSNGDTSTQNFIYYSTNGGASISTTAVTGAASGTFSTFDGGKIIWTGTNYITIAQGYSGCPSTFGIAYASSLAATSWNFNEANQVGFIVWTGARAVTATYSPILPQNFYPRYSTNSGVSWASGTTVSNFNSYSAAYGASIIVAVGYDYYNGNPPKIYTSPDGGTWTSRTVPSGMIGRLNYVAFTNSLFIAADLYGNVCSSADGITWTYKGNAGVSGEAVYLAATSTYYMNGRYSSDLITWSNLPIASNVGPYVSTFTASDGTRVYGINSNVLVGTSWNPFPYTTGTQFIVPNFGSNGLGNNPFGAYNYIKT
jgi:hypothetical protein